MKYLLLIVLFPIIALADKPQVQESISPITKHDDDKVQFTLTSQAVEHVILKLEDLIEKRDAAAKTITDLQAQVVKLDQMIAQARAVGVKTQDELDAEKQALWEAQEAIKAAKVKESAASVGK